MKSKKIALYFVLFLFLGILSINVVAISGASGSLSSEAGTSASGSGAASGSISSTFSAGGSPIGSSYAGAGLSGSSGMPLTGTVVASGSSSTATDTATDTSSQLPIPGSSSSSRGGGSGSNSGTNSADSTAELTAPVQEQEESEKKAETKEAGKITEGLATKIVIVTKTMSSGQSLSLSSSISLNEQPISLYVVSVDPTSTTIKITSQTGIGGITGAVVANMAEEVILSIGDEVEVDTNDDDITDVRVQLTEIKYNETTEEYEAVFKATYLHLDEETAAFVQTQLDTGDIEKFETINLPEKLELGYWFWIVVGSLALFVMLFVGRTIHSRKKR